MSTSTASPDCSRRDDVAVARAEDGDVVQDVDQEEAGAGGRPGGDDQVGAQDLSLRRTAETDRDGDGRRAVRPSPSRVDLPAGLARLRLDGEAEGRRLLIGDHRRDLAPVVHDRALE